MIITCSPCWFCRDILLQSNICSPAEIEAVLALVRPVTVHSSVPSVTTPLKAKEIYRDILSFPRFFLQYCKDLCDRKCLRDKVKTIWLRAWQRLLVALPVADTACCSRTLTLL